MVRTDANVTKGHLEAAYQSIDAKERHRMKRKSPSRTRNDLESARNGVNVLIEVLRHHQAERRWGLGDECAKAIAGLQHLLKENQAPPEYKVAVIGRFKAGKSTFVNVLLDQRLAGVDTSPETAAVTTFRAGTQVVARIKLIDKVVWDDLKALFQNDPADTEAHRIANWFKFAREPRPMANAQSETFDLAQIERELIRPGGHTITISMTPAKTRDAQRKAESEFQRQIRTYTSSTKPYHCLVQSIDIETPSALLGEGVMLVDTPGLDDTERFRVQLTERAVQDVDAVLFLTKSGASYGQSEKDFVLSLLRKGTIKQLIFVVTQVDQTYEQHVREARDQNEDPQPISTRIEAERARLRTEIEATLNELTGETTSASIDRYRDQLSSVEIAFTSAANHLDHVRTDPIRFPISLDDPGGMRDIKSTLYRLLSTESRLAANKQIIQDGVTTILQNMLSVIETRRTVVSALKSQEVAESKLATFRGAFEQNGKRFSEVTRQDTEVLGTTLANRTEIERHIAEIIALQADEVLASYETDDAARHWRTRRNGRWGHMHELQTRIANRVFPKVAEELNKQSDAFGEFVEKFRVHLKMLSNEATETVKRLEIGDELQLDIGANLGSFLDETLGLLQQLVEGEETQIIALLEEFVDEQVEQKIVAAREKVSAIWGRGTTVAQTTEVRSFYAEVRSILKGALRAHVLKRFNGFGQHLTSHAKAIPEKALSEVGAQIEQAAINIRTAAEATITGQKEAFDRTAAALVSSISAAKSEILSALADNELEPTIEGSFEGVEPAGPIEELATRGALANTLVRATKAVDRYVLRNGAKGWSFTRIFAAEYLRRASEGWLIDPYLARRYQRRNLKEFIMVLLEGGKLKSLHIITREVSDAGADADKQFFDVLDRDTFAKGGMRIEWTTDKDIHDRSFALDNGYVFKLGRGLDIFKPAAGLASRDASLREVRPCEINVFGPEPARSVSAATAAMASSF